MTILSSLFGSEPRVKILRLFLLNQDIVLSSKEVTRRARVQEDIARKEISLLSRIGFISKKVGTTFDTKSKKPIAKKIRGWQLDQKFPFTKQLRDLLVTEAPYTDKELLAGFRPVGKFTLIVTAGIFINQSDSRADLLLVGDNLKRPILDRVIKVFESELGRELTYVVLETGEFEYRHGVHDKLIRDIFDYPHKTVLNKLGVEE